MGKTVQIPAELFTWLLRYHCLADDSQELPGAIEKALTEKLNAMVKHELYSKYKNTTLSPAEREAARQQYLDSIGLRDSFRWPEGWPENQ